MILSISTTMEEKMVYWYIVIININDAYSLKDIYFSF